MNLQLNQEWRVTSDPKCYIVWKYIGGTWRPMFYITSLKSLCLELLELKVRGLDVSDIQNVLTEIKAFRKWVEDNIK